MLLSENVMVRWNGKTKNWYEGKGYVYTKMNDLFECKIEDVMTTSPVKVQVQCDYCGNIFEKPYRNLFRERELVNKDCCNDRKCMVGKSEEISLIKYGVKNYAKTKESKEFHSKINRESWDVVVKVFESKGLELISEEEYYKNDRSRLKFMCSNHRDKGVQETNFANVKKSKKHCCKYGGEEATGLSKRLDGKMVYDKFLEKGLTPLFEISDYKGNSKPLPYKCKNHLEKGIQYRDYASLTSSKDGCPFCARESGWDLLRSDINIVIAEFEKKNLTLLSKSYKSKDEKLEYECNIHKGHIQTVTYAGLKRTKCPCLYCREEKYLTKLSNSIRSSLTWWRKYSKKEFNNTCLLSGIKGNIEIHHQKQFNTIIKDCLVELKMEVKDIYSGEEIVVIKKKVNEAHKKLPIGICLNKDIHILFHIKYGKKECEKKDFDEFTERYFNGEFDDELRDELKSVNSIRNLEEVKKLASFYYVEN